MHAAANTLAYYKNMPNKFYSTGPGLSYGFLDQVTHQQKILKRHFYVKFYRAFLPSVFCSMRLARFLKMLYYFWLHI